MQDSRREDATTAAIHLVRFRLKANTDEAEFKALNERFQKEVAPTLAGLERREATRGTDGEWLLVLRYASMAAATGAGRSSLSEVAKRFVSLIDPATMSSSFYEVISP